MIKKAIFTNSSGILFSRILGFLRDLLTANVLGASIYSDIFFVAFKFPNLFRRIFGEGAFSQSFLPELIGSKKRALFMGGVFVVFLSIILLLTLAVNIFDTFFTKIIAYGFSEEVVQKASTFVAINFWYLDLIFIVTFLGAILQFRGHFAASAYSTALLNLALIGALLLSKGKDSESIVYYLSFGVLVGGFLQILLHLYPMRRKNLLRPLKIGIISTFTRFKEARSALKGFFRQFFPALLGSSTAQISAFIDTFLASFLAAGSISYLYYANRIFQLPLALFAIATSVALFPSVAKAIQLKDETKALNLLKNAFWLLAFLLGGSVVGGMVLSKEIIELLFMRGAFDANDAAHTSEVFAMYMLGLLPFGMAKILSLWLYAHKRQGRAALISAQSLGIGVVFSLILIVPMGAAGLALAGSIGGFTLFFLSVREFGYGLF